MSRRAVQIQDVSDDEFEFDDDTDLPLPSGPGGGSRALPNTGTRGALLEEIGKDFDYSSVLGEGGGLQPHPPSNWARSSSAATSPSPSPSPIPGIPGAGRTLPPGFGQPAGVMQVTDTTPYKDWTSIYPIYFDAKRPYGTGKRRVSREKGLWWPLSQAIATAAMQLRISSFHEPNKRHPRDWENPGRVKVLWKENGRLLHPHLKTKKQLLEAISRQIQRTDPSLIPTPDQLRSTITHEPDTNAPSTSSSSKKAIAPSKSKSKPKSGTKPTEPPSPLPEISQRLPPWSPALESGVLLDTMKVALGQGEKGEGAGAGAAGGPGGAGMAGKGKRKVIRVRG